MLDHSDIQSSFRKNLLFDQRLEERIKSHSELSSMRHLAFDSEESRSLDSFDLCCAILYADTLVGPDASIELLNWIRKRSSANTRLIVLSDQVESPEELQLPSNDIVELILPTQTLPRTLIHSAHSTLNALVSYNEKWLLIMQLAGSFQELQKLTRVALALSTERDFDALLGLILDSAREMVCADSGSIYVVEKPIAGVKPTHIRFKRSALGPASKEFLLPINANSIAGYVALTGLPLVIDNVYELTGDEPYRFNTDFDLSNDYYSRSMLLIPMRNHNEEVIGVIQLINRKRNFHRKLSLDDMKGDGVTPFSNRDREIALALAGLAAVAIENNQLIDDIQNLLDGFVQAAVTAIEQRDPITSGHSFRVAELTVGLAEAVDAECDGPYASIRFTPPQLRELRYASLLHDFGKVAVREKVLSKEKKLDPLNLEAIRWRFQYIRSELERNFHKEVVDLLRNNSMLDFRHNEEQLRNKLNQRTAELDRMLAMIETANEPSILEEESRGALERLADEKIFSPQLGEVAFLQNHELLHLSVTRGNLTDDERREIESHVSHSFTFLSQIPWTIDLSRVPSIAHGHHEKLNGQGYPLGLAADQISIEARMMAIADIYDALTAPDRPYKRPLTSEESLEIIGREVERGHLDAELYRIFLDRGVYLRVAEGEGEGDSTIIAWS